MGRSSTDADLVRFIRSSVNDPVKRILLVTNMWPDEERPWYGTFIKTQADSLAAIGLGIDVLYIRGYKAKRAYSASALFPARVLRDGRYHLVHAHYGHSAAVARLQARAPLVISYCGDDLLGTPADESGVLTRKSRIEAAVFRRLAHLAAATVTKSEEMERCLPSACRARNHVIPNGVDISRFERIERSEARRRLGWAEDEPTALFVGNPELPRKNFTLAEQACRIASASVPDLQLRTAWDIAPEEVVVWMSAADALLFPSKWEGSPNAVKEAMAAELPIVATPVGDIPERLRGLPGCFVCPSEPEALASALNRAVQHGRAAEAREAILDLSLENVARRVDAVYDQVLSGRSAPSATASHFPGSSQNGRSSGEA